MFRPDQVTLSPTCTCNWMLPSEHFRHTFKHCSSPLATIDMLMPPWICSQYFYCKFEDARLHYPVKFQGDVRRQSSLGRLIRLFHGTLARHGPQKLESTTRIDSLTLAAPYFGSLHWWTSSSQHKTVGRTVANFTNWQLHPWLSVEMLSSHMCPSFLLGKRGQSQWEGMEHVFKFIHGFLCYLFFVPPRRSFSRAAPNAKEARVYASPPIQRPRKIMPFKEGTVRWINSCAETRRPERIHWGCWAEPRLL